MSLSVETRLEYHVRRPGNITCMRHNGKRVLQKIDQSRLSVVAHILPYIIQKLAVAWKTTAFQLLVALHFKCLPGTKV